MFFLKKSVRCYICTHARKCNAMQSYFQVASTSLMASTVFWSIVCLAISPTSMWPEFKSYVKTPRTCQNNRVSVSIKCKWILVVKWLSAVMPNDSSRKQWCSRGDAYHYPTILLRAAQVKATASITIHSELMKNTSRSNLDASCLARVLCRCI